MATSERETIIDNLFESMNAMKRGMHSQLQMAGWSWPISRSQLELLFTIKHSQPVSSKQLAKQLYLSPGAISQLAESLAQQTLITRETDLNDRRIQSLKLTKKGDKLLQDVEKKRRAIMQQVMQELNTEELRLWLHIQQKLIHQFQTQETKKEGK